MVPVPAAPPHRRHDGGGLCNLAAGCNDHAEVLLSHVLTDDAEVAAVEALSWPSAVAVGDAVAVYACHAHVPAGEAHVHDEQP